MSISLPRSLNGRKHNRQTHQAVIKVFPEVTLLYFFRQVLMCSGNNADVKFDDFVASQTHQLPLLQYPQYFCLEA